MPADTDTDDEEIKPRTMRRAASLDLPTEEEIAENIKAVAQEIAGDDDDDDAPSFTAAPIAGGWTAGQKTMDAGSPFAKSLKLDSNVQVIKFLEDAPYANYSRHWVDRMTPQGPKTRAYACLTTLGRECPLCKIGDRPTPVSSFNVVLVGDNGECLLKSFDVGVKLFQVLKAFANDPKIAPLTKGYFAVSKSGSKQQSQTNVIPIGRRALDEDYGIQEPSEEELAAAGKYDASIIQVPKKSELEEIALEIADY